MQSLTSIIHRKYSKTSLWLRLQSAIYRPDSFVLMLRYCVNLKAVRYESTSLKRIVADKSHRVNNTYSMKQPDLHYFETINMMLQA